MRLLFEFGRGELRSGRDGAVDVEFLGWGAGRTEDAAEGGAGLDQGA